MDFKTSYNNEQINIMALIFILLFAVIGSACILSVICGGIHL